MVKVEVVHFVRNNIYLDDLHFPFTELRLKFIYIFSIKLNNNTTVSKLAEAAYWKVTYGSTLRYIQ
ncbi:hypothetical protein BpHYR1_022550 [Brachionus plicatilis]|uniref:Uncharacterized protein n=1 Tax=Brachionus plicatilis TaxID=10195 RepID=A0A3M7QCT4_BRAPC|nr:hypothetical protein BpHYR1_022550 [Brachionus plicatilis]